MRFLTAWLHHDTSPGRGAGRSSRLLTASFCLLLVVGCSVKPQPLTSTERDALLTIPAQVQSAVETAQSSTGTALPAGPITLEQALAHAIKHNLDYRLIIAEQNLRIDQAQMANLDMLPRLVANAGWFARSEEHINLSKNIRTGQISTDPFVSQDKTRRTADLTLTWDVLDFGVSYYQARQGADQVLIAHERRRRVMNQIAQQVRTAYWQAATVEPLWGQLAPLLEEARQALDDARRIEEQRLIPPLEILYYQKGLIEVVRDLEFLERELAVAKAELATLMGLPPGTDFTLAQVSPDESGIPRVNLTLEEMEKLALSARPELREEVYQRRISADETRKALLRMLPGLSLFGSVNYDSNSFLIHDNWNEVGARVTWNLMNLATGPAALRAAKTQEQLSERRRLAAGMATLVQIHVGYQQYLRAARNYEQARELGAIENRIFQHIDNAASSLAQSPLQRLRAKLSAIFAESSRYRAFAELQNAVANLYVSIGLSPIPETAEQLDLTALQQVIGTTLGQWNAGEPGSVGAGEQR